MHQYKVSARGRVTIPKAIREQVGLLPGAEFTVEPVEGGIAVIPLDSGGTVPEKVAKALTDTKAAR